MPHTTRRSMMRLALLAILASPSAATAQAIGIHATVLEPRHSLLDDAMKGGGVNLRFGRAASRLGVRITLDHLRSSGSGFGSPCAGLIQPGTCPPEPLLDNERVTTGTGGVLLRVLGGRRMSLGITADAVLLSANSRTRGQTSGRALSASKIYWGGLAGLEASWTPVARYPNALVLGGATGGVTPTSRDFEVDGYTPFDRGFDLSHVRVGVTWRMEPRE